MQAAANGLRGSAAVQSPQPGSQAGLGAGPDNGSQPFVPPNAPGASLYAPRTTETSGSLARVPGQVRPSPESTMSVTTEKGAPTTGSDSRVPYYEVIGDYSKAAEEAIAREDVPPAYRSTVREYFKALEAGKKQ